MNKLFPIFFSVLLIGSVIGSGCNSNDVSKSHTNADQFEENAIGVFQADSKYSIVSPMLELKESVEMVIGENYWPDTLLTEEELAERIGVSSDMYDSFLAEYQRAEAGVDRMILIKAKKDAIPSVEKALNDYRTLQLKIYEKQPMDEAKIFASRIETIGSYVCYVQLGADVSKISAQDRDKIISHCQEENERAIDILERKIALKQE